MSETSSPVISLVMAVYNGESQLRTSIESILKQTYTNFEFVIIDDGSTDATPAILAEYAARDSRIVIVTNEANIGLTKSLNRGIAVSIGTYIARMDAGDTSETTRFEKQISFMQSHPDYSIVGTWAYVIDENGTIVGKMRYPTDDQALRRILIRYNPFVHSSVMMRRNVVERVGLYDETWKYAQDYELFFRMVREGKCALIGEYLVSYRVYPQSITRRKNKAQIRFAMRARMKAIREHQYSIWSSLFLIRPLLGFLLPYQLKQLVKKILS